jgi:hypothetical protein
MQYTDSWTRRQRALVAGLVLTGAAFALPMATPAGADAPAPAVDPADPTAPTIDPAAGQTPAEDPHTGTSTITDTLQDLDGNVISTTTYDEAGNEVTIQPDGSVVPVAASRASRASGSGGTSTRTGCRVLRARNEQESSYIQATLFWYNTTMRFCWNRDQRRVYDVTMGYYLEDVYWTVEFRGQTSHRHYPYEYRSGYKNSGYISDRQAHFTDCFPVPGVGTICSNFYPRNILRGHDNGTYSWATS